MEINREQLAALVEEAAFDVEEEMFINQADVDLWKNCILRKFDEREGTVRDSP